MNLDSQQPALRSCHGARLEKQARGRVPPVVWGARSVRSPSSPPSRLRSSPDGSFGFSRQTTSRWPSLERHTYPSLVIGVVQDGCHDVIYLLTHNGSL